MAKHTPGAIDYVASPNSNLIHIETANVAGQTPGLPICSMPKSREADAARIVLCWNAHDELMALLQQAADCMTQMLDDRGLQKSLPLASYKNSQRVHGEIRTALSMVQS